MTGFFVMEANISKIFEHLVMLNNEKIPKFFQKVFTDPKFSQFNPAGFEFTGRKALKTGAANRISGSRMIIPRMKLPENGMSLFFWLKKGDLEANSTCLLAEITESLSPAEVYLSLYFKEESLWLSFLDYSETKLEKFTFESNEWIYFGLVLSKNKEVFTINLLMNGILKETRFYIIEKYLKMTYRLLTISFCVVNEIGCRVEIGPMIGFRKGVSESEALMVYLSNNASGLCDIYQKYLDLNEKFLDSSKGKLIDFSLFLRTGIPELSVAAVNSTQLTENLKKTHFFFNLEPLLCDLFLYINPKNYILLSNESILQPFYEDFPEIITKNDKLLLLTNSSYETSANYLNKAAEWLHVLFVKHEDSALHKHPTSLKTILSDSSFPLKLLKYCKEKTFLKIFSMLYQSNLLLQKSLNCNIKLRYFLIEVLKKKCYEDEFEIMDIFALFSINGMITDVAGFKEYFWNHEVLKAFPNFKRKNAVLMILTKFLNEENPFSEVNVSLLREGGVSATLVDLLFKEASDGLEMELINMLYLLIKPYGILKFEATLFKRMKSLMVQCYYNGYRDKINGKFETPPKKLETLLENGLLYMEKLLLTVGEDIKMGQYVGGDYFISLLYAHSLNSNPTEISLKITKLLVRNLLVSMEGWSPEWMLNNMGTIVGVLQPYFAEGLLFSKEFVVFNNSQNNITKILYHIFLLQLLYKGLETIRFLWNSCLLLENVNLLVNVIHEPKGSSFIEKEALSVLNMILKKSQNNEISSLQSIPKLEFLFKCLNKSMEFFKDNFTMKFSLAESLIKTLTKFLMFKDFFISDKLEKMDFPLISSTNPLKIEILACILLGFLKKKEKESDYLFLLDKLILQIQSELNEEFTLVVFQRVFEKVLEMNLEEIEIIFLQFTLFLMKYLKKIMRKGNWFSEMMIAMKLACSALQKKEEIDLSKKKPKENIFSAIFHKKKNQKN